jgi:4-amino-4-deoxy-L-arabinose transferase-like glycosyltransferase
VTTLREKLVLGLLLAISFVGVGRDLWTPDEPREAEISREMWLQPSVVPSLNGEVFIEKPPLYYWTVASVFALLGERSAMAARGVSCAASFLTLLLVFFWGRRAFSAGVGVAAALGLATSAQFMITAHWIVIDPLLMLFTTAALFTGFEIVRGRGTRTVLLMFYAALTLALCAKGLIGPVLVGAGLLAYAAARRSLAPIKLLHPVVGVVTMLLGTGALATLIGMDAGAAGVREWLWVNHVQRFVGSDLKGHDQPFYYYLYTLPVAVFPWWLPFAKLFRPNTWRAGPALAADRDARVYLGAVSLGMALLLSASTTKRGLYLLPLLPPLFLLLAATAADWWARRPAGALGGVAWWAQFALSGAFAAGPAALGLGYLRIVDPLTVAFLALVVVSTAGLARFSRQGDRAKTLGAFGACTVAAAVGLLVITVRLAAPAKDMSPFIAWVGEQTRSEPSILVLGDVDETLAGIIPFVTGRRAEEVSLSEIDSLRPRYVLVQCKDGRTPMLGGGYKLLREQVRGQDRYFGFWVRRDPPAHEPNAQQSASPKRAE